MDVPHGTERIWPSRGGNAIRVPCVIRTRVVHCDSNTESGGGSQEKREWRVGVGAAIVAKNSTFYGESWSREYQVGILCAASLAPSSSTNQQSTITAAKFRNNGVPMSGLPGDVSSLRPLLHHY